MANTLPIIGTNNLGLTSKVPRWDHRLRFQAGSLVIYDTDLDPDTVTYGLFFNPSEDKDPTLESDSPVRDADWVRVTP